MIRIDCEQGSKAWFDARLSLPTSSQFHRILTPRTLKLSEGSRGYMLEKLAEWMLGEPVDDQQYDFTERGTQLEQGAREWYEMQQDVDVEEVGFCLRDDRRAGGSPDGFVGEDGIVEFKCPAASTHVGYLLLVDGGEYKTQVQGNLWVTGREWTDWVSYHPTLPPVIHRYRRDDVFIKHLERAVTEFCDRLDAAKAELVAKGYVPLESKDKLYFGVG